MSEKEKSRSQKGKPPSSGSKSEDSAAVKGGKHSHMNDPHPLKKSSSEDMDPNDPAAAARKGGHHSHTGGQYSQTDERK